MWHNLWALHESFLLCVGLNESNAHHSKALSSHQTVNIVDSNEEHIQTHEELVQLAVHKSQEAIVPVHKLNKAVDIRQTVIAPDGQRIRSINLGVAVNLIRFHELNHNNRRENQHNCKPGRH